MLEAASLSQSREQTAFNGALPAHPLQRLCWEPGLGRSLLQLPFPAPLTHPHVPLDSTPRLGCESSPQAGTGPNGSTELPWTVKKRGRGEGPGI